MTSLLEFVLESQSWGQGANKFLIMLGQAFVTALLFPGVLIQTRLSGTTYKSMELLVDV